MCKPVTIIVLLLLGILEASARTHSALPQDADEGDLVLFRKVLEQDRQILVVKGRTHDVSLLRGLIDPRLMEQATGAYPIRIELHGPADSAVVIASRLRVEALPPATGDAALDVLAEVGQIVVVMIEGHNLAIWSVPVGSTRSPTWTVLPPSEWSVAAPLRPLDPKHIKVKLLRHSNRRIHVK